MRLIIAGSRPPTNGHRDQWANIVGNIINSLLDPNEVDVVLSGTAPGVDRIGEAWAQEMGVTVERYPANWDQFGKRAGYLRNKHMAENADTLLAVWNGESKGTRHMINVALDKGLDVVVKIIRQESNGE